MRARERLPRRRWPTEAEGTGGRASRQKAPPNIVGLHVRTKVWLEAEGGRFLIGEGGWHLLRHLRRLGSLAAAARHVGWSYRHAWGYLRQAERTLGAPLTHARPGKGAARGTALTPHGRALLALLGRVRRVLDHVVGATGVTAREIAARHRRREREG